MVLGTVLESASGGFLEPSLQVYASHRAGIQGINPSESFSFYPSDG